MAAEIISVEALREFLGADSEKDSEVGALRAFAIESVRNETGKGWEQCSLPQTFNEAVRAQCWLSYYGVRDAATNTEFLQTYLSTQIRAIRDAKAEGTP